MNDDVSLNKHIIRVLELSRAHEPMNAEQLGLKLSEEVGELAATVNVYNGNMPHKQLDDTPFEETADVINVMCGILNKLYPELTTSQIIEELNKALLKKGDKYASIIGPK